LASKTAEKGLELAYIIDPNTPEAIVGDDTRLRQILVNLLSNAVKFTEKGEIVVSVSSEQLAVNRDPLAVNGDPITVHEVVAERHHRSPITDYGSPITDYQLHFSVKDTGIGIPADRMDRLFRSFSQVDASTTRRYGGTGLGLAISKRLSEMMGGTMWAESDGIPGQGTTFCFTIETQAAPLPVRPFLQEAQPDFVGKRLLIVDDNATNRRILNLQAESWQMIPEATGSPQEALAWLQAGKGYDAVITDMQMPEMDGLALANAIRNLQSPEAKRPSLPIIMLTSLGRREALKDSETTADHFAAFLTKPIKPSQLFNALAAIFSDRPQRVLPSDKPTAQLFDVTMGQRHPLHILLAEDHPTNQKLALRILERLGYRADVAANGLEVLVAIERQHYDVVLMDMQMPEMDGLEATRRIRQHEAEHGHEHLRIVAMTANAMQGDRELCFAAGMDDYVSKPIRVELLVEALSKVEGHEHHEHEEEAGEQGSAASLTGAEEMKATILDPAALANLQEMVGDDAFMVELIETFLADAPKLMADMATAVSTNDAPLLRMAAHSLKSNTADFGATALNKLCVTLEGLAKEGQMGETAANLVTQAQAEYKQVEKALHELAHSLS
jgi:CheY-like chemotaxis protein/HPt (histidine-containing phosphotransfer) domain-containing protein